MFFNNKLRVEEDLERIKRRFKEQYDTPPPSSPADESEMISNNVESEITPGVEVVDVIGDTRVGIKDIFAMIIAVFSLLLPFLITMFIVFGLFFLLFFRGTIF